MNATRSPSSLMASWPGPGVNAVLLPLPVSRVPAAWLMSERPGVGAVVQVELIARAGGRARNQVGRCAEERDPVAVAADDRNDRIAVAGLGRVPPHAADERRHAGGRVPKKNIVVGVRVGLTGHQVRRLTGKHHILTVVADGSGRVRLTEVVASGRGAAGDSRNQTDGRDFAGFERFQTEFRLLPNGLGQTNGRAATQPSG